MVHMVHITRRFESDPRSLRIAGDATGGFSRGALGFQGRTRSTSESLGARSLESSRAGIRGCAGRNRHGLALDAGIRLGYRTLTEHHRNFHPKALGFCLAAEESPVSPVPSSPKPPRTESWPYETSGPSGPLVVYRSCIGHARFKMIQLEGHWALPISSEASAAGTGPDPPA